LVASLIDEANLQIKKAQTISDKRGEAFRIIKQSITDLKAKFGELEGKAWLLYQLADSSS
jgi:hypothetical protein